MRMQSKNTMQRQRQYIRNQCKESEMQAKNLKRRKEEVPGGRKWRLSKMREVESLSEK